MVILSLVSVLEREIFVEIFHFDFIYFLLVTVNKGFLFSQVLNKLCQRLGEVNSNRLWIK